MKPIYVFFLCLTHVYSLQHPQKPTYKNETIQGVIETGEKLKNETSTRRDTKAKESHKNVYTFLESTSKRSSREATEKQLTQLNLTSNHHDNLVQSYINATKLLVSKNVDPSKDFRNEQKTESTQPNVQKSNPVSSHQHQAREHLEALKNVIALHLSSYRSYNDDTKTEDLPTTKFMNHEKNRTEKIRGKKRDVLNKDSNKEMYKKLAVIAAAEALMKILDA